MGFYVEAFLSLTSETSAQTVLISPVWGSRHKGITCSLCSYSSSRSFI